MFTVVLADPQSMDVASVAVEFPISDYEGTYRQLEDIGIGDTLKRDCYVAHISGDLPILKRLMKRQVNVDELDYLAKRLMSFSESEKAQFQATAVSKEILEIADFINLTFCCQDATVIQVFSDLDAIGRRHYLTIHPRTQAELDAVDGERIACELIDKEKAKITPYGVVYENGMSIEPLYDGESFPEYDCGNSVMAVEISKSCDDPATCPVAWLYLPMEQCQIERAMSRAEIRSAEEMRFVVTYHEFPSELDSMLSGAESIWELNNVCSAYSAIVDDHFLKLRSVLSMAPPSSINQVERLIGEIENFDFFPGVSNAEEYGEYMIKDSGRFEYDPELEDFYDFERFGDWRIRHENGHFTPYGYVCYSGEISFDELPADAPSQRTEQTMGGL